MKKYLQYIKYVIRHKWYVMIECFKVGLYWRGLTHDMSKFLSDEFFPYVEKFYGDPEKYDFMKAFRLHAKRNDHHWQYWVKEGKAIEINVVDTDAEKEMLCDWIAMSKTVGRDKGKIWYEDLESFWKNQRDKMQLHPIVKISLDNRISNVIYKGRNKEIGGK